MDSNVMNKKGTGIRGEVSEYWSYPHEKEQVSVEIQNISIAARWHASLSSSYVKPKRL